jgi:hypothetical protein
MINWQGIIKITDSKIKDFCNYFVFDKFIV